MAKKRISANNDGALVALGTDPRFLLFFAEGAIFRLLPCRKCGVCPCDMRGLSPEVHGLI
jgi:hypothetical protein